MNMNGNISSTHNNKQMGNTTHLTFLEWDTDTTLSQRPALIFCVLGTFIHALFWIQVCIFPSYRRKNMQWIFIYLIDDQLLLLRFFFSYIVHTRFYQSAYNLTWAWFVCIIDATVDNYLNIITVYILLAINICRYFQIVYNRNVYNTNPCFLIIGHFVIYVTPIVILAVQLARGWGVLVTFIGDNCDVSYDALGTQIFNAIYGFCFPILLNVLVILLNLYHVHLKTYRRRAQIRLSARDKYHRSLVTQFLLFYIIWLTFWSPDVLVYQFTVGQSIWTEIASSFNYVGIALDPIVIAALDVRVRKGWIAIWHFIRKQYRDVPARIAPIVTGQKEETRF